MAALRVLLVEDSSLDAELTQARLEALDYPLRVDVVDNERDFRACLAANDYDIILADFMLPQFSGPEALVISRKQAPDVPFVFVSGVLGEEHAVDMLKQGATDYVLKQRLQRLPTVVQRALAQARERHDRIRAERALREYETSFRLLINALRDYAVIGLDVDGRIRSWNSASEHLLGYPAERIMGETIGRLYESSDGEAGVEHSLATAARDGSHVRDLWMKSRSGEAFFASVVTTAIHSESGELIGFSKIIRDMTEARRSADALKAAKDQAEAANAAKDRFLAMLSHELRTPLTPVMAAVTLLERKAALSDELSELVPMIRRNIELEARLIDDLLDLTSIAHGKTDIHVARLDLHDTLGDVLATVRVEVQAKNLQLETRLDARRSQVDGDFARLQQIVSNLLRNAIKFTPPGGCVSLRSYNPDDEHVAIRIEDSGIGISEAAMPRIFTAFEQADTSITRQFGGLGLGLAIAQALARKHGGELLAESHGTGRGSAFTMILPLIGEMRVAEAPSRPVVSDKSAGQRSLHILLVEDNHDTTIAMVTLLELSGHSVSTAGTIGEAQQRISDERFDLLISDLGLPDGDGADVARAFSQHQQAPSIAMTGYGMDEDLRRCREAGFTAHVTKPIGFDQLNELIRSLA
ncbi:response regulator [Solimonas sp. C16B3]|uniref:histidine kinase n=1 Tax=Solimonas marina TaxID=2714601 RepID=A0A970BAU4_9GAMM|nr:response regulator [Solimonas marina]